MKNNKSLINQSITLFEQGYSCSQAVLAPFAPALGIDRDLALRIAQPFNGGMSRTGSPCGAVTGAVMAIGLKFGQSEPADTDQAQRMRKHVQEFASAFKSRHGSIFCKDLLGYDLSNPDGLLTALQNPRPKKYCSVFVRDAAEILIHILGVNTDGNDVDTSV